MFYYFTQTQHALSNIALKRIKISQINELNDPYELSALYVRDPDQRTNREVLLRSFDNRRGIISFSDNYSSPIMWGHYADKHAGICLGFDIAPELLFKVTYISDLLRFDKKVSLEIKDASDLLASKHISWNYERESRIFVSLEDKIAEHGNYFEELSEQIILKEVILGYRCQVPIDHLLELVGKIYNHRVFVKKARLAFTNFKVVEDRNFRFDSKN